MDTEELFKGFTEPDSECVEGLSGSCLSKTSEKQLKEFVDEPHGKIEDYIEAAKEKSGCTEMKCVAKKLHEEYLKKDVVDPKVETTLREDVKYNFKPFGPREGTMWLSNVDIEGVLEKWSNIYRDKVVVFPYCMIDFEKTGELFNDIDLESLRKKKYMAMCVLNTDVSSGPGKHWICTCIDMSTDSPTIEYFDSGGRPPPKPLYKKLLSLSVEHKVKILMSSVVHQRKNTECGVYCLYFLDSRLRGRDFSFFTDKRISDENIQIFRKYLFAPNIKDGKK